MNYISFIKIEYLTEKISEIFKNTEKSWTFEIIPTSIYNYYSNEPEIVKNIKNIFSQGKAEKDKEIVIPDIEEKFQKILDINLKIMDNFVSELSEIKRILHRLNPSTMSQSLFSIPFKKVKTEHIPLTSNLNERGKKKKKVKVDEPFVAFKNEIEDPENNPFPTLSGKIEIYCEHIAEKKNPLMPPIPKYLSHDEHYDSPKAKKYPLQLLTPHNKRRTHSSLHNIPWLEEVEPHTVWINPINASQRNINNGDLVDIYNDQGRIRIPTKITERIIPGAVCVYQGAWYNPDKDGVDLGGCPNVLTRDVYSPGGAFPLNSSLVEIELTPHNKKEVNS